VSVATSVLLGAVINFAILAPIMIEHGDIVARTLANGTSCRSRARMDLQHSGACGGHHDDGRGLDWSACSRAPIS
jgi:hypothetical protein